MLTKPSLLSMKRLGDVAVGAIVARNGGVEGGLAIRLADQAGRTFVLHLIHQWELRCTTWDPADPVMVLVEPEDVLLELGEERELPTNMAGVLGVHLGGAYLNALDEQGIRPRRLDLRTWDIAARGNVDDVKTYSSWAIGNLDSDRKFKRVYGFTSQAR